MSDSGTTPLSEAASSTTTTCDQIQSSSKPAEPAQVTTEILTPLKSLLEECQDIVDWNDVKADSDHKLKDKSKSLESEPEQRNTSTSNAGESEYESANEEELLSDDKKLTKCEDDIRVDSVDDNIFTSFDKTDSETDNKPTREPEKAEDGNKSEKTAQATVTTDKTDPLQSEQSTTSEDKDNENQVDDDEFDESLDEEMIDDLDDESFDESLPEEIEVEEKDETTGDDSLKAAETSLIDCKSDSVFERESGDGEESAKLANEKLAAGGQSASKATKRANELAKKRQYIQHPQYIPRARAYFEHDDRDAEEEAEKVDKVAEEEETEEEIAKLKAKKKLVSSMKLRSDEMDDEEGEKKPVQSRRTSKDTIETEVAKKVEVERKTEVKTRRESRSEAIWSSGERWSHDCFNEDDQRPKTREELIDLYGYDIRNETEAPKLQRRSKYGKGPQKYSRRPDDQNAYAKKTLRKVIRPSGAGKTPSTSSNTGETSDANNNRTTSVKRERVFDNKNERRSVPLKETKEHHPVPLSPRETNAHVSTSASNSRSSYSRSSDGSARVHENDRVFVNKNASASSKFSKMPNSSDRPKMYNNNQQLNHNNNSTVISKSAGRETNLNNASIESKSGGGGKTNQLFSKDDFPELLSAKSSNSSGGGRVIYYQNSSNQVKDTQESRKDSKHSEEPAAKPVVVESAQYENSRYRNRTGPPTQTGPQYYANSNWNNRERSDRDRSERTKPPPTRQEYTNQRLELGVKKAPGHVEDEPISEHHVTPNSEESRPKRYSSIRQQQRSTVTTHSTTPSSYEPVSVSQASNGMPVNPSVVTTQVSVVPENNSNALLTEPKSTVTTTSYYDPSTASAELPPTPSIIPAGAATASHHHPTHNFATINGTATPSPAPTAYLPTAAGTLLYYDATTGQATPQTAPLGLTQAYYTTDQTGAAPAQNYYLTPADMTVAYHPAYHLPTANYPQALSHTHQSHVASRYLNTTPSPGPSAESNRYLQTTPANQNSTPLLATPLSGQPYQATLQSTFPSGYPQFPGASQPNTSNALSNSTPLPPAGYPNVQLGSSTPATTVSSGPPPTVSGYPEMYRGGITYYDIQSQQQAMQRMQITTQPPRRTKSISGKPEEAIGDHSDMPPNLDGATHPTAKSEISVNN